MTLATLLRGQELCNFRTVFMLANATDDKNGGSYGVANGICQ